ncbi:methylmalonyl-CoA mutase subunit beta [Flavobacteriaceae bacterium S356]|uniref:Methylmalonyl-CoA mutase subunit beta n=1 Tax=Asprobacillus argus TaxID=3076534 RepID=A0ABU3LI72_9FLAO|nr:methylmalonyl-CoA mutase subunit beta [Flavobacteriaceae bacterium S356]
MSHYLFEEFSPVSPAAWKQKIQVDLKGLDYNETLLHTSSEGIVIKPFYTSEDRSDSKITVPQKGFNICQSIFIDDEHIANTLAKDALKRGANAIQFIANRKFDYKQVLQNIEIENTLIYFKLQFLDTSFIVELSEHSTSNNIYFQLDIVGNLARTGNWYTNLQEDFSKLEEVVQKVDNAIMVDLSLYQNAGANIVQQLAYTLAHANEYLNKFSEVSARNIHFTFSVGSNYFFEIAKIRAFRLLWDSLVSAYGISNVTPHIFTQPSIRNKTLYDYNVNMLRTTSESMSAILGSSDTVSNITYDALYHKSNEFGERISRNQLLILQQESYLAEAQDFAEGAYYIEKITSQLAEKSLDLLKKIEKKGGFLKLLKEGTIQKKINESANKEQEKFNSKEIVLLGSNVLPNDKDSMKDDLEIYPFLKKKHIKTLISPILIKRLSESYESERLNLENNRIDEPKPEKN